jgi:hypothetical protein
MQNDNEEINDMIAEAVRTIKGEVQTTVKDLRANDILIATYKEVNAISPLKHPLHVDRASYAGYVWIGDRGYDSYDVSVIGGLGTPTTYTWESDKKVLVKRAYNPSLLHEYRNAEAKLIDIGLGAYTTIYVCENGDTLCADCAEKALQQAIAQGYDCKDIPVGAFSEADCDTGAYHACAECDRVLCDNTEGGL